MKKNSVCRYILWLLLLVFPLAFFSACYPEEQPTAAIDITPTNTESPEKVITETPTAILQPLLLTNPIEVSPLQIGLNHAFRYEFNQPVDQESFEANLAIQPAVAGQFQWDGETAVTFIPNDPLALGTHYTINLSTEVYAKSGVNLTLPVEQNFSTVGPLNITSLFPVNQEADVNIQSPIWVTFNQPVAENTGDEQPVPFSIEPAIPGSGRWANPSTFIFYPSEAMVSETTYTIRISAGLASQFGTRYEVIPEASTFTTNSPAVLHISPEDLSVLFPGDEIILTFNQAMDQESVAANLRLEDKNSEEIQADLTWNTEGTALTISKDTGFDRDNTVLMVLNPAAKTLSGIPLGESTRRQYATLPNFAIDEAPPTSIEVEPSGYTTLEFHTNVPMDPAQDFLSLIDVRPRTPGEFSAVLDQSNQTLTYSGFFVPGSFYSYSLSPDLKDQWGQPLGDVLFNRFATQSAPSAIMVNQETAAPSQLYFPINDIQLPIETTNIRRVDMQSVELSIADYIRLYCDFSDCLQFESFEFTRFWYQSVYPYIINTMIPSEVTMAPRFRTLEPGLYVFELDAPDLKSRDPLRYFGIAANTILTTRQVGNELLIWAMDQQTLEPIINGNLVVYDTQGVVVEGGSTDAYGLLSLTDLNPGTYHIALNEPGDDDFGWNTFTVEETLFSSEDSLSEAVFFFDRPGYAPGDTVNFLVYPQEQLTTDLQVQLMYEMGDQENPVDETVLMNIPGTGLQGSFRLPESLPLGSFSLRLVGHDISQPLNVFESPTNAADIEITLDEDALVFGNDISGEFALLLEETIPIVQQEIQWQVVFTDGIESIEGNCLTDENGVCQFEVLSSIVSGSTIEEVPGFRINASSPGLEITRTWAFSFHNGAFVIEITPEDWLAETEETFGVGVTTRNHDQSILPTQNLDARFEKVIFTEETIFIDGKAVYQTIETNSQIASTAFTTDENGYARLTFTPPTPGLYRLVIQAGDFQQHEWIYVNGNQTGQWLDDGRNITTITDKSTYQPGDSAQLFLPNPFNGPAKVLLTIQNRSEYREQIISIDGSGEIIDLVLKASDVPAATVTMTFIGFETDGRLGYRNSEINLVVETEQPELAFESELQFTEDQKGLFRVTITDDSDVPVQAQYSLLILPSEWIQTQADSRLIDTQQNLSTLTVTTDIPLDAYIRHMDWTATNPSSIPSPNLNEFVSAGKELIGNDTIFLTNLSTNTEGESFIEFPFIPHSKEYSYILIAVTPENVLGKTIGQVELEVEVDRTSQIDRKIVISNSLTSPSRVDISVPIPFGIDEQNWQLELFSSEIAAIQSFSQPEFFLDHQPVTAAGNLLATFASNKINQTSLSLLPYLDSLSTTQNADGGWGFIQNSPSDPTLTSFITFCLMESGSIEQFGEESISQLVEYLSATIAQPNSTVSSRYVLQALTLSYQDVSEKITQIDSLSISELIWLNQALAQQSDTEEIQKEILNLLLSKLTYDEYGAYLPSDGKIALYAADETATALLLLTLVQQQPSSDIIPQLRSWLIHQAMTTSLQKNPIAFSLTLLSLDRTNDYAIATEDYNIQIVQEEQTIARFSANEIITQPFVGTFTINAASPNISIIHEEGAGALYYRLTSVKYGDTPLSNGIVLNQSFFPAGETCRPGFCIPTDSLVLADEKDLIKAHLTLTVLEDMEHIIIDIPSTIDYQLFIKPDNTAALAPPVNSPLDYGLQTAAFQVIITSDGPRLYAPQLAEGTYEVIYYVAPNQLENLVLEPISAVGQFNGQQYARTTETPIELIWESNDE